MDGIQGWQRCGSGAGRHARQVGIELDEGEACQDVRNVSLRVDAGDRLADLDRGDAAGRQDPSLDPRSELLALLLLYEELRDGRSVQVKGAQRRSP